MKTINRLIIALGLCLSLALPTKAATHQITSLSTSAVSTILIVPNGAQWVTFANAGTGPVNCVADGGASTGYSNTDPTTGTTGIFQFVIPAASSGVPGYVTFYVPGFFQGCVVRAIMQSGTTTLNEGVKMLGDVAVPAGTFPTN